MAHVIARKLAFLSLFGIGADLTRNVKQTHRISMLNVWYEQTAIRVRSNTNVDVVTVDDLLVSHVHHRIKDWVFLHDYGQRLGQVGHKRQVNAMLFSQFLVLLAVIPKLVNHHVIKDMNHWNLLYGTDHCLSCRLANWCHLFIVQWPFSGTLWQCRLFNGNRTCRLRSFRFSSSWGSLGTASQEDVNVSL